MPVTFGAVQTLTGHGEWTYPDTGLVVGLLLQVSDPGTRAESWGDGIVRYRQVGVWAPITEAGRMHAEPFWNDTEVTYDIGKGPVGLAYDLQDGAVATATEILSESPPIGGGGVDRGQGQLNTGTTYVLPGWETGAIPWDSAPSWSWAGSDTTGLVAPADGLYVVTLAMHLVASSPAPNVVNLAVIDYPGESNLTTPYTVAWPPGLFETDLVITAVIGETGDLLTAGTRFRPRAWTDSSSTVSLTFARFAAR